MPMIKITQQTSQLILAGELTRKTVTKSFEKKSRQLLSNHINTLSLAAVSKVDTAGLAWLLMMLEQANRQAIALQFIDIPQELTKLAKLSAVDSFLPIN